MSANAPLPSGCAARYSAARLLGSGGFADVWLAKQTGLERHVVVKLLHAEYLDNPALVERFLTEARVTAALSHPNIVIVIDHGVDGGVPWIVYEYLPRGSLADLLERGPTTVSEALKITLQISAALEEAHAHGVLHRDIKPANVLEAGPGTYKVVDFGVAKWIAHATVRTQEGLVVGSPAYLAPEQLLGANASPRTDVWAAGLVLYQMIAGALPARPALVAAAPSELLVTACGERTRPADAVLALIDRALATDPEKRFASATELMDEATTALLRLSRGFRTRPGPTALDSTPVTSAQGTVIPADRDPVRAALGRTGPRAAMPGTPAPTLRTALVASLALGVLTAIPFLALRARSPSTTWSELPASAAPTSPAPRESPAPGAADGLQRAIASALELLTGGHAADEQRAASDDVLRQALDAYHERPVAARRALWSWAAERPGLAEAIRLALALFPRASGPAPRQDRLSGFLRDVERAEQNNPLYWAVCGLATPSGPAPKDPGDIDPGALAALHDGYTGLYLALERSTPPSDLAEATLLLSSRRGAWRPASTTYSEEWLCWRLFHVHVALDHTAGALPPVLAARLELEHAALHRELAAAAEAALALGHAEAYLVRVRPGPQLALLSAEAAEEHRLLAALKQPAARPAPPPPPKLPVANVELEAIAADPVRAFATTPAPQLQSTMRAAYRAIEKQDRAQLAQVERWLDELRASSERVPEYWLMRCAWLAEAEHSPDARVAYLRGTGAWFHIVPRPGGSPPPPAGTRTMRGLHEMMLELMLARLISSQTAGVGGEFGVAYDFAAQVESTLRGTMSVEESMTSLQRATICAHLEQLSVTSEGIPVDHEIELKRSYAKALAYRATLVSRTSRHWLLARAHERAVEAVKAYGYALPMPRARAIDAELARIQARLRELSTPRSP